MPHCPRCGRKFICGCGHPSSVSDPVAKCPLKKGAIWVHVVDDKLNDIQGVTATVNGGGEPSDQFGIAKFDPLDATSYTVDLSALTGELAKTYDLPSPTAEEVGVSNGEITYVPYELKRKPWELKVRVKSVFDDLWPSGGVALSLPGDLTSGQGTLEGKVWVFTMTGVDPVNGEVRASHAEWAMKDAKGPVANLKPGVKQEVDVEVHNWRLTATVESTTAFGWPKEDVALKSEDGKVLFPSFKMTSKTATANLSGLAEVDSKLIAETPGGWTLEAPADLKLKPGDQRSVTLKLKGVKVQFQLMDAATTRAAVKDEPVKVLREEGTEVPSAPAKSNDKGMVELVNVPPENYKIKLAERYDDEWEFSSTEALTG